MVTPSPDKTPRVPTLSEMAALGMYDIQTRGLSPDPAPTNRGLQKNMKATEWMTTITSFAADRPMIRAIRDTPEEADRDAKLRFMAIFEKGQDLDPVLDHPSRSSRAKPTPRKPAPKATEVPTDDDLDDLV